MPSKYTTYLAYTIAIICTFTTTTTTYAIPGDMYILREATGGELVDTNLRNMTWDTTVFQDNGYTLGPGQSQIVMPSTGHYLVFYNLAWQSIGGTGRSEIQGQLYKNNTPVVGHGQSTCYIRGAQGADECFQSAASILSADSGDTLQINAYRTDTNSELVGQIANTSGLTLLKLDESLPYLRLGQSTGGQAISNSTPISLQWDTPDEQTSGYFTYTNDIMTLTQPGKYLLMYSQTFLNSTTEKRNIITQIRLNNNPLNQTKVTAFMGGADSTQNHTSNFIGLLDITNSNSILSITAECEGLVCGNVTTGAGGISITRLGDSGSYAILNNQNDNQPADTSNTPINWKNTLILDTNAFRWRKQQASRLTIHADGAYLFLSSFWTNRPNPTSDHLYTVWSWRLNGNQPKDMAAFGQYNRGNASQAPTYTSGASGAVIFHNLKKADYLEILNNNYATGADNSAVYPANNYGLQAIYLENLFIDDGTLSVHFVDQNNQSVVSPNFSFPSTNFTTHCQTVTTLFSDADQHIQVSNSTYNPAWSVNIAATNGPKAYWKSGGSRYDFNDPTGIGCQDGSDQDNYPGQMIIDPSTSSGSSQIGCSLTGLSQGAVAGFHQNVVDSITLVTAGSNAATNCSWDLYDFTIRQTIPAEQAVGSYDLDMTISIIAQ